MSKFQEGDKVRIVRNDYGLSDGDTGVITNAIDLMVMVGNCPKKHHQKDRDNYHYAFYEDQLELVTKSLDNLEEGDVLVDDDGDEHKVIGVAGEAVILWLKNIEEAVIFYIQDLKKNGWKLKDAEEDITELTLEEVAELKGIPVEKLRIKEK